MRAVAAFAGDIDRDAVGRSHHGPGVDAHRAGAHLRPVVHGVDRLHGEAVEQTVFDHGLGTGKTFFTRLEDQHRGAIELPRFGQVAGRAHQHGGVTVVAAAVHHARFEGFPGKVVVLRHGQGIHVGAQADHVATLALAAVDHGHHPCLADAGVDFIHATHLERLDHALRGVVLLETDFGVRVQIAPQRGELREISRDVGEGAPMGLDAGCQHVSAPPLCRRAGAGQRRNTAGQRPG
ncbi:hypothetical protein FQZ97_820630 [compost metagenome]